MMGLEKRRISLLLCLLFIGGAAQARGDESLAVDWGNAERTHVSCGTGGTKSRMDEPEVECIVDFGMDQNGPMNIQIPQKPELERRVRSWIYATLSATEEEDEEGYQVWQEIHLQGNLLSLLLGNHCVMFDLANGRELTMSDVFYDGFNYIDYINRYIADHLLTGGMRFVDGDYGGVSSIEGILQTGPFTGFPNDYPYSLVGNFHHTGESNALTLLLVNTPFVKAASPGYHEIALSVPLTHEISPWAECKVLCTRTSYPEGSDGSLLCASMDVDDGAYPDAQQRINTALRDMADGLWQAGTPDQLMEYENLLPNWSRYKNFLNVYYEVWGVWDTPVTEITNLPSALFDLQ